MSKLDKILLSETPQNPEDDEPADREIAKIDKEFTKLLGEKPCVSRPSPKPFHGLRIIRPGKPDKIVEYFGVDGDGDNAELKFITGAHRIWEITIKGRNLARLLSYLKERRIDWIRQEDREFGKDGELVIKSISLQLVPADQLSKGD